MTLTQQKQGRIVPQNKYSASRHGPDPSPKPPAPRVLVVEDEIFVAWHLEATLGELNYAVCAMNPDGESAVARAAGLEVDLVLMDINLKGEMDGVEAARRIREHCSVPVIFTTAYSDSATLSRIREV